jgi:hypothetical protein
VLLGVLGKRTTAIYLATIALSSVLFGLAVDKVYVFYGLSAKAMVGQASEIVPLWGEWAGAIVLLLMSVKPVSSSIQAWVKKRVAKRGRVGDGAAACASPT